MAKDINIILSEYHYDNQCFMRHTILVQTERNGDCSNCCDEITQA